MVLPSESTVLFIVTHSSRAEWLDCSSDCAWWGGIGQSKLSREGTGASLPKVPPQVPTPTYFCPSEVCSLFASEFHSSFFFGSLPVVRTQLSELNSFAAFIILHYLRFWKVIFLCKSVLKSWHWYGGDNSWYLEPQNASPRRDFTVCVSKLPQVVDQEAKGQRETFPEMYLHKITHRARELRPRSTSLCLHRCIIPFILTSALPIFLRVSMFQKCVSVCIVVYHTLFIDMFKFCQALPPP